MYELWDRDSGNRIGEFKEAEQAYELASEIVEDEGSVSAGSLVLIVEDDQGHSRRVMDWAQPPTLAELAERLGLPKLPEIIRYAPDDLGDACGCEDCCR